MPPQISRIAPNPAWNVPCDERGYVTRPGGVLKRIREHASLGYLPATWRKGDVEQEMEQEMRVPIRT